MIDFGNERSPESSERHERKADKGASVVVQKRFLARQAVHHSERLALAYVLADHSESETAILPHRDVARWCAGFLSCLSSSTVRSLLRRSRSR